MNKFYLGNFCCYLARDALSRRTLVTDSLGGVTTSTFDFAGNLTSRYASSSQVSRQYIEQDYNALGQVTQVRRDTGPGVPYINVANTDYVYDAVGQVRSIHDTDNASGNLSYATYTFDAAHRLTSINRDSTLSTCT